MTTATSKTVTVDVMSYATGDKIGETTIFEADRELYAGQQHPGYQWPEGIAKAKNVVPECGIYPETVIWLDV